MKLDIESLRALRCVAEHGGVTRAASHLSLTQSAVSHKLKRLEDCVGATLLGRRAKGPLLTETGERLLGYAVRILALHDEAVAAIGVRRITGQIRLGMTEDMSSSGLARVLGRFSRLFPDVTVTTQVAQSLVLRRQVSDGVLDVAVLQVFAEDREPDDVFLFTNRLVWAKARELDLPQDGDIPFIAYDDDCFYKAWVTEAAACAGRAFRNVLTCSSNAGMVAAIEAGLGVSILNDNHVSEEMDVLETGFPAPPPIDYVVRATSDSRQDNAIRLLMTAIAEESSSAVPLRVA